MRLNYYIIYFIILSFCGYIYETIAMTLWSMKFENRGFMIGPIIPIYGTGAVIATLLGSFLNTLPAWQIFLFGLVASAVIEYPTHYFLEKVFGRTWWDYSKAPLNINGRVCLPAAMGFGLAGLLILKVINPFLIPLVVAIPEKFANVLALLIAIVFTADLTLTLTIISNFEARVLRAEERMDDKMSQAINPLLNEDKKLSVYFYTAVDRVKHAPSKLRTKWKNEKSKEKGFYKNTIKRLLSYRAMKKGFSDNQKDKK